MADARNAYLVDAQLIGPDTRLLSFHMADSRPLGFIGGQYIIVNTGIPLPGGKIAKRAYSILSPDADQQRLQIAVKRLGAGPGSNFMHDLTVGAGLTFSGPWGKFYPAEGENLTPTLVFATDTGITAALGMLRGSRPLAPGDAGPAERLEADVRLIWLTESLEYFIPPSLLKELLPAGYDFLTVPLGLPVNHPDRVPRALALARKQCAERKPRRAFLAGDGAILFPLCEELQAQGLPETAIRMECFFNNLFRKAP